MGKKIRKIIYLLISMMLLMCVLGGCSSSSKKSTKVSEDFSFALTFGTYGISSYDSSTGKLVKTTDATNPSDYITTMYFGEEELDEIREMLERLDVQSYPDEYDPINDPNSDTRVESEPSDDVILTVTTAEWSKTITCKDIAISYCKGYDGKSQEFLEVYAKLRDMITSTKEWEALPEYEFFYD